MGEIRTLIVDDEALSRERLRTLLDREADVEIIGECAGGAQAIEMIRRLQPDLVFLDVQMPDVDGFGVLAEIGPENCPAVVFATSYDQFALRAFEANAVDYLLKPVSPERLRQTLKRAGARARGPAGERFQSSIPELIEGPGEAGYRERLAVRAGNRFQIVRTGDLVWIEAADNYVRLRTGTGESLYRATMAEMTKVLDPARFIRIHRSVIISVDAVRFIEPWGLGEYQFVLSDGRKLASSRKYRDPIRIAFDC
jgi:two-component system LytT family response regulator